MPGTGVHIMGQFAVITGLVVRVTLALAGCFI
jgi:hypothetical protein